MKEKEWIASVVNTVIVRIRNVGGLGKANGGKRAVIAKVKGYKVDAYSMGGWGRERKTAGETK